MKVNKSKWVKGQAKSLKWKDVRGKRCRPPVSASDPISSPVIIRMAKEHQAFVKKKPNIKRLKSKAKPINDAKKKHPQSGSKKSHAHANGSSVLRMNDELNKSEEWKQYSKSVHRNGVQTSAHVEDVRSGRMEAEALHNCAERDDRQNHAVLVMQKDQTLCFRGKCLLTCLYGRVEVMGFTIEEGQQSYPLFSPASHCPLTIRALESSDQTRDETTEALPILRKYLQLASWKKLLKKVTSHSSIILLEPMETPLTRFLSSFTDLSELFNPLINELMSAVLDTPLNGLGMIPLGKAIEGLNITASVDYLEGDLGQTEFTPAGCLSLSTVRGPLLGTSSILLTLGILGNAINHFNRIALFSNG
ncbi:Polynucleotide 5'-hydroxyl-kinase NOL9 [Liparis tanakae]|uniref:Polynucleotide 5'-hydroxyl-kinase NOL9 n=1 Tax=Liparis tanakae TaxID=230148 RepID=A0A4Z2FX98_9TELE|nr:Polynucleotide 5'-hydroxyl-kinase NOL9 [Liparis tanakae]